MFIIIVNRVSAVVIFTSKHNMLIKKLGIQSCLDTYNASAGYAGRCKLLSSLLHIFIVLVRLFRAVDLQNFICKWKQCEEKCKIEK